MDGVGILIRQANIEGSLDLLDIAALALGTEGCRGASGAGASRPSDPVDEVFGDLREIEVHYVCDAFNVNASGGYIGGD